MSVLPREICFLPIQVLLVSNNRLVSLPEELGRMDRLTELDVASNQMSHLPARMSDLKNLRSLSLRSNQLVYLPREVTYLYLVSLDISNNRIASLPVELRTMSSLVNLELENNPLTSPPASVSLIIVIIFLFEFNLRYFGKYFCLQICVRGLVHVFKFLENVATKEDRVKSGGFVDGHGTLRRTGGAIKPPPANAADSNKYNTLGSSRRTNSAATVAPSDSTSLHDSFEKRSPSTPIESWSPTHLQQQYCSQSEVDSRLSPQSIRSQYQSGVVGRSLDSAIDVELKSNSTEYNLPIW